MPLNYKSIQKSSTEAQSVEIYECTVTSALVKSMSIYNGSGGSADVIAKIKKSGQSQKVLYQNKSIVADSTIQLLDEVVILENGDEIWIQFSAGSIDSTTMLVESTAVLNATSVKELSDWSTTTPNDGQVPTWNSATGQYEPVDSSATISDTDDLSEGSTNLYYTNARADARIAAASIDDLSDVDTTTATPTTGQALLWDGTQWEPGTVSTVSDLDGLTDVSASSPTNGDVIVYNGAINTWVTSRSLANLVDKVKDPTPDTTVIEKDASNKITIDNTTGSEKISATVDGTKALELTDTEARVLNVVVQDQNEVQFKQVASNGGNYVSLKAPAQLASNVDFVLPNADGASGTFLKTNGSGALSFASITEATGSELENVVEDTTPQLGGNLDVNGNKIVSASNGDIVLEPDGTGNVGIGTTTPNYLLDVESDGAGARIYNTAGSTQLYLQAYTNNNSTINFADLLSANAGAITYRHASDSLAFDVNAAERIRIDSSGNVGIGTTSPSQKLHVNGSIQIGQNSTIWGTNTTGASVRMLDLDSGNNIEIGIGGGTNSFNYNNVLFAQASGNVGIGTTSPDHLLHVSGNAKINNIYLLDSIIHEGDVDTKIKFSTDTIAFHTAGSERLTINSSGNLTVAGRADFQYDLRLRGTDSAANLGIVRFYADSSNALYIDTANDGSNLFTINSSGKVGIGTTSPSAKLDVVGNIKIGADEDIFSDGSITIGIDYNNNQTDRVFNVVANNSTELFRVQENGNVGIGTTTPASPLHIYSNDSATGISCGLTIEQDGAGDPALQFLATGARRFVMGIDNSDADKFKIASTADLGSDAALCIDGDSNVGIGTTTPSQKLDVVGQMNLNDGSNNVMISSGNSSLTGTNNTAIGYANSYSLTTGEFNVSLGNYALNTNQTGSGNTSIGYGAAYSTTGSSNTAVGYLTGYDGGQGNAALGAYALRYNTGNNNVAVGVSAARGVGGTSSFVNTVAVGYQALTALTTGTGNTAVGFSSLRDLTAGANNTAVGYQSMLNSTTGDNNTAVGHQASYNLTTGNANISLGNYALYSSQTGEANTAIGYANSYSLTTGVYNVSLGNSALYANQTGGANVAIGYAALNTTTSGNNTAVGHLSAYYAGASNAAFGAYALNYTTGSSNVAIGFQAARGVSGSSSFSNTVAVGYQAGAGLTTGGSNVLIGFQAGSTLTTESDKLYIENSNSSTPLIYGEFDNDLVRVNGDFEVTGGYGFNGEGATAVQTGYTPTNVTTTRSFDADSVTLDSLADVVGTLIEDLKTKGLISA